MDSLVVVEFYLDKLDILREVAVGTPVKIRVFSDMTVPEVFYRDKPDPEGMSTVDPHLGYPLSVANAEYDRALTNNE